MLLVDESCVRCACVAPFAPCIAPPSFVVTTTTQESTFTIPTIAVSSDALMSRLHFPQLVDKLTETVPIAVPADAWEEVGEELDDTFLGDAQLTRRPTVGTANPTGVRCVGG